MLGYMGVLTEGGADAAPAADPRPDSSDGIVTIQQRAVPAENQP